jgi:hypothetical protein
MNMTDGAEGSALPQGRSTWGGPGNGPEAVTKKALPYT